jgi:hypothetical protein
MTLIEARNNDISYGLIGSSNNATPQASTDVPSEQASALSHSYSLRGSPPKHNDDVGAKSPNHTVRWRGSSYRSADFKTVISVALKEWYEKAMMTDNTWRSILTKQKCHKLQQVIQLMHLVASDEQLTTLAEREPSITSSDYAQWQQVYIEVTRKVEDRTMEYLERREHAMPSIVGESNAESRQKKPTLNAVMRRIETLGGVAGLKRQSTLQVLDGYKERPYRFAAYKDIQEKKKEKAQKKRKKLRNKSPSSSPTNSPCK